MLTYRWVESNSGPPRKYFSLTPKGEEFYKELEATWNELANAVNQLAAKKESLVSTAGNVSFEAESANTPTNTSTDKQEQQ
jgi:PadR family transcriptional regulator PadR